MGRPVMLVILVDALGWDVVQRGPGGAWLADLLPHRRHLTTVLGFSSGAIPALLSGSWPAENGRWLMFSRARGDTPLSVARWFARLPARLRQSYRVSRLLHRAVARRVRGYFSLYEVPWELLEYFDLAERDPLYEPGGLGGQTTWFDRWAARQDRVRVWDWRTPEEDNAEDFVAACGRTGVDAADVLFWYTPGQDALQHRLGTRAAEVERHLAWLGEKVREGAVRARAAGRPVWVYLLSDHGMTDVDRVVDVMGRVRHIVGTEQGFRSLHEGTHWLPFYDSTLARFWWTSEEARERLRPRVREGLDALDAGCWLEPEEQRRLGVYFEDGRYGEDIFLLAPGCLIAPSYMGTDPVRGMHGYHPDEPTSRAVLLSNRPLSEDLQHVVQVADYLDRESSARDECPARES